MLGVMFMLKEGARIFSAKYSETTFPGLTIPGYNIRHFPGPKFPGATISDKK